MARKVTHFFEGSFYEARRELGFDNVKTLCNRVMTHRYIFSAEPEQVTCGRCLAKLAKKGILRSSGRPVVINKVKDIGTCGDEQHDLYLQRLGIG